MASLFTPSPTTTSSSGDTIYVAAVPLKAAAGPPQLIMSMAYSLNISNLQHFMVLIKPSSPIRQEVLVFDFQPHNDIECVVLQRRLKNVPRQRCWMVGSSKGNDAMEMAMEFNKSWETDLRVGFHDCRHYTNELVQHLTGEMQIVERLPRS
ncbi:unnamed protein product [Arabidopsis thaliana]|uniref:(thale cress) hypothetical protein n=1 Tax=Arabidopsis thaliana TaxID=3702 RepID=A0A7G2E5E8_ARATH|nr:unnamed protein product [Arabidopsis thaliana]